MSSSSSVVYPFLFIVEYYDPLPRLKRQYLLKYWGPSTSHGNGSSNDNGFVEMTDIKTKKLFLKKSPVPETISPSDMIINAKVCMYICMYIHVCVGRFLTNLLIYIHSCTHICIHVYLYVLIIHLWLHVLYRFSYMVESCKLLNLEMERQDLH